MGGGLSLCSSCRKIFVNDECGGRVKLCGLAQVVDSRSSHLSTAHNHSNSIQVVYKKLNKHT